MNAKEHAEEWWADVKARMPPFHHRSPVEFIEEEWHKLVARLHSVEEKAHGNAPQASTVPARPPEAAGKAVVPSIEAAGSPPPSA